MIDIDVLGALSVKLGGIPITPTAPKTRQVLATLSIHPDQVVSVSTLTEELWGPRPPRSARNTLQTYVLQVRELIADALRQLGDRRDPKAVLATLPGGYQLLTQSGALDAREFERRAAAGYRSVAAGDVSGASRRLTSALDVWKGPAFSDVRQGRVLSMECRRLEEARLCVLEQRIDAELALGRHRELIGELTVLTDQHRTHEALHRQLIVALHRSGRRGEALMAYQRLRSSLVNQLGLEPSPTLRRLQRSILTCNAETAPGSVLAAVDGHARVG
jgi:SARP family transcriptional regulator, regulator of embCAB operon